MLDEPTTGLDPALRLDFYDIVEARRTSGATIVLSSHALAELGDRAGRIIIMNQGRMVAIGTNAWASVLHRPVGLVPTPKACASDWAWLRP